MWHCGVRGQDHVGGTAGPSAHRRGAGHAVRLRPAEPRRPPTLELGKVSLKKVGSQDSRMKKEQAAESWEKTAALQGGASQVHGPSPQGGQRPWETLAL